MTAQPTTQKWLTSVNMGSLSWVDDHISKSDCTSVHEF